MSVRGGEQSDDPGSGGQETGMTALSLLASSLALWAGTAMLLSRLPWFRDSVSLAERLAPYAPNVEASWPDEVERWLGTVGEPGRREARVRSSRWRPLGSLGRRWRRA